MCVQPMPTKSLDIFPPSAGIAGSCPSCSNYIVGFQATTCFIWTRTIHARQSCRDHRRRLLSVSTESRSGKPCVVCVNPWSFANIDCVQSHGFVYLFISNSLAVLHLKTNTNKQLLPAGAHVCWSSISTNNGDRGCRVRKATWGLRLPITS
jgi:hypothetical protein